MEKESARLSLKYLLGSCVQKSNHVWFLKGDLSVLSQDSSIKLSAEQL